MCCVELIKEDIAQIYVNTSTSNNEDIGVSIDDILDDISFTKSAMSKLAKSVDKLYNNLHDCFMTITEKEYNIFVEHINFIKDIVGRICSIYKDNAFNSYSKEIEELENSLESLKEIDDDIRMFIISLPKDKEYCNLVSELNKL